MATTIKLKNGSGAPLAGDLVAGEPALDLTNKRLYTEDSGGTVIEVGTNPSTLTVDTTTLVVDAGNNRVGVGTASPDTPLEVSVAGSGATDVLKLTTTATNSIPAILFEGDGLGTQHNIARIRAQVDDASNGGLVFETESSGTIAERLRIDSSGNLLVGTTNVANSATVPGHYILPSGLHTSTRDGGAVRILNRLTSDGDLMIFRKDNVGVGVIGTQNWGIGTTSPTTKLDVFGKQRIYLNNTSVGNASSLQLTQDGTGDSAISFLIGATTEWLAGVDNSDSDSFKISNITGGGDFTSTGMTLTTAGNVGIGVTPEAWNTYTPIQVQQSSLSSFTNGDARLSNNAYYSSGWKYIDSRYATQYLMDASNGVHTWSTAASGTADGAITWSERMRIDSSGNVGIGTSSPQSYTGYKTLHVAGPTTTGSGLLYLTNSDSSVVGLAFAEGSESRVTFGSQTNHPVTFLTNDTERMRIDGSGNVGIGTSSPNTHGIGAGRIVTSYSDSGNLYGLFTAVGAGTGGGEIDFGNQSVRHAAIASLNGSALAFYTNSTNTGVSVTERMRIDSSGVLMLGRSTTTVNQSNFGFVVFPSGLLNTSRDVTGTSGVVQFYGNAGQFRTMGDGDAQNTNNSYGAISDERLKSNIVDASSQIDDIMAVQVRSYTLNETGATHIGVVAQELEASGMSGLVKTDDEGMKSVKYSVLYMKAIKALQEAVTRIETLEAEVAALKGA